MQSIYPLCPPMARCCSSPALENARPRAISSAALSKTSLGRGAPVRPSLLMMASPSTPHSTETNGYGGASISVDNRMLYLAIKTPASGIRRTSTSTPPGMNSSTIRGGRCIVERSRAPREPEHPDGWESQPAIDRMESGSSSPPFVPAPPPTPTASPPSTSSSPNGRKTGNGEPASGCLSRSMDHTATRPPSSTPMAAPCISPPTATPEAADTTSG